MNKQMWGFILYFVLGVYLVNVTPLNFVEIPDFVSDFNPWIIFAGAVLLILNSFRFLRKPSES